MLDSLRLVQSLCPWHIQTLSLNPHLAIPHSNPKCFINRGYSTFPPKTLHGSKIYANPRNDWTGFFQSPTLKSREMTFLSKSLANEWMSPLKILFPESDLPKKRQNGFLKRKEKWICLPWVWIIWRLPGIVWLRRDKTTCGPCYKQGTILSYYKRRVFSFFKGFPLPWRIFYI